MRRKRKKKVPRYIKVGKVKLSREEWEGRTALTDYFKPGKIVVVLKEAKPKEEEIELIPVKKEDEIVLKEAKEEIKLVEKKEENNEEWK